MILFLGSGVSLASKLPSVAEIRTELLKTEGNPRLSKLFELLISLDTDYLTYSAPFRDSSGERGYTGQVFRAETTYEDLFYLIDQIGTNGEGLKADVTIGTFAEFLRMKSRTFLRGKTKIDQAVDLHHLANEARKFIENKVAALLRASEIKGL